MNFTYDSNGLLVNYGDGGDSAGREGDYWFFQGLTQGPDKSGEFQRVLNLLQVSPGVFIRNPTQNPVVPPAKSWNDPSDFSRDQAVPLMLAMGVNEVYGPYKLMLKKICDNWWKFPNGDWASPEFLSIEIRSFKKWYLYPLLIVGDMFTLGESIIRAFASLTDTSDDINHTLILLQSQYKYPTPVSWLARKVYKWFRPGGIQAAWDSYFKPNSCTFNLLYHDLIERM